MRPKDTSPKRTGLLPLLPDVALAHGGSWLMACAQFPAYDPLVEQV
ncbi:MAG: hypothetical protein O6941_00895 [Planctomycetota bacterium]|nr:hypothetical protein [Planctomycetota bacterium]MCZ6735643.1 hypothetical protein [Planctomycetota bacterium]